MASLFFATGCGALTFDVLFKQGAEGIKTYGIDQLIQVAAAQLSDQLPESREAARTLLLELQNVYEKFHDLMPATVSEHPESEMGSWENFCQSKLSPLSAQAVLRVTSIEYRLGGSCFMTHA